MYLAIYLLLFLHHARNLRAINPIINLVLEDSKCSNAGVPNMSIAKVLWVDRMVLYIFLVSLSSIRTMARAT